MKKILLISTLGIGICLAQQPSVPAPPPIAPASSAKDGQYNYFFNSEPLRKCIDGFAKNHGYRVVIAPELGAARLNERVSGRFNVSNPNAFLDSMSEQYGFNWFAYSGTLYITSLKQHSTSLDVSADNMPALKNHLELSGILNSRFGYAELSGQNKIVITGPREYVDIVAEEVRKLNVGSSGQQFAVFRLKYASAIDLQYSFNNQQFIVPGVASILQGLTVPGKNNGGNLQILPKVSEMLSNSSAVESMAAALAANAAGSSGSSSQMANGSLPVIQADSRLNTIIVRANSTNLQLYRDLIRQLDVPSPLIQIEVMIVKLDQDKLAQEGVNWWASGNNQYSGGFGTANLMNGANNNLTMSYNQINPGQLVVTNMASFTANLQFLQGDNIAQAIAKPSLATSDNLPAVVSTTEFISSITSTVNNNSTPNNNLGYTAIQIVHSLQITPHVISSPGQANQIKLNIALQDGAINEFSNPLMPNYAQSYLNSQAVIMEGQSLILAGYTRNADIKEVSKIPYLGDIPLLGWFFKSATTVSHKVTTLYVVTPRVVWVQHGPVAASSLQIESMQFPLSDNIKLVPANPEAAVAKSEILVNPVPASGVSATLESAPANASESAAKNDH